MKAIERFDVWIVSDDSGDVAVLLHEEEAAAFRADNALAEGPAWEITQKTVQVVGSSRRARAAEPASQER